MNHREAEIKKTPDEDGDRISALPDGVLCRILSFLPPKHAATTTILSTRWKYLFSSLPNLDLDDSFFFRPPDHIDAQCFLNFVYRLLLLRKPPHVNRFRLTFYERYDNSHLIAWIRSLVSRNVKELHIDVRVHEFGMFPSIDIFTCKTLVDLTLKGEYIILQVPNSFCLPNVKVLDLSYLIFNDDESIRRVFSGCPSLEELKLFFCRLESVQRLDISSPSLKSLVLFHGYAGDYQIVLNAPVLEYLEVSGFVAGGYLVKDLKSLVTAHLSVELTLNQKEADSLRYGCYVTSLVNAISGSVKLLYLSGQTLEAINYYANCSLPAFRNLTQLQLETGGVNGWKLLDLLQSAPNLEVLDFTEGFLEDEREPGRVPICLSQCIKEIVIREFTGDEVEIKLMKYFLSSGKVLKKITIVTDLVEWPTKNRERFLTFPNCSKTCQIVLETRVNFFARKQSKHGWLSI